MLKASGIWVSPAEVEARLLAHPAVAQAVVVAAPDADGLEKPVAYVILEAGQAVTEDELIEFCRQALPSFKRPRKVVFVGGYPTTATGKIRRVELRRMAATVLVRGARGWGSRGWSGCRGETVAGRPAAGGERLMLDGRPLVDVHLHPPRLPTLKPSWREWAHDFGDRAVLDRVYDAAGSIVPAEFAAHLAGEGVDIALLLCEYSPKATGIQPIEDLLPLAGHSPDRLKIIANVNPHLHYPVDEELQRQLGLGAVALKIHPVHAGAAVNDRALYPAYEVCQSGGIPVVVHSGTSSFPGSTNALADPALLDDVLRDFRRLDVVLAHGGRGWWYDAAAFLALSNEHVWIELSGLPPSRLSSVLRPAQLEPAHPEDDLRHQLARRPRHREERPGGCGAVPGRGHGRPGAGR